MMYYLLMKNDLKEWVVFSRSETKEKLYRMKERFEKAGIPLEHLKIVDPLCEEEYVAYDHIVLTMASGEEKSYEIHNTHPRTDFLAYVQMAITGQLKQVISIQLLASGKQPLLSWTNEYEMHKLDQRSQSILTQLTPEDFKELQMAYARRNAGLRKTFSR